MIVQVMAGTLILTIISNELNKPFYFHFLHKDREDVGTLGQYGNPEENLQFKTELVRKLMLILCPL